MSEQGDTPRSGPESSAGDADAASRQRDAEPASRDKDATARRIAADAASRARDEDSGQRDAESASRSAGSEPDASAEEEFHERNRIDELKATEEFKRRWAEAKVLAEDGKTKEAAQNLGIPEDHINSLLFVDNQIGDKETLSDGAIDNIVQKCIDLDPPFKSEHLEGFIEILYPQLNKLDKQKLLSRLKAKEPVTKEEDEKDLPEEEKTKIQADSEEMQEELQKMADAAKEVDTTGLNDKDKKKVEVTQARISKLSNKLNNFLHPEDPLKTWSKRGGKALYYMLFAAFLLLIAEMNLINKAARGSQRR